MYALGYMVDGAKEEAMRKFDSARIGVEQGNDEVFSDFLNDGSMWTGHGPRERRRTIVFSEPFLSAPVLHVALSLWDVDQRANVRADLSADNVSELGFDLVFRTWGDTRVARVRMNWLAVGEVASEDDWHV